eukprot:363547-Chlamydomonas_euryale.AAC.7
MTASAMAWCCCSPTATRRAARQKASWRPCSGELRRHTFVRVQSHAPGIPRCAVACAAGSCSRMRRRFVRANSHRRGFICVSSHVLHACMRAHTHACNSSAPQRGSACAGACTT